MNLDIDIDALDAARRRIGAPLLDIDLDADFLPDFQTIDSQLFAGIDVTIDDVGSDEGVFTYEGRQVVIYIKAHNMRERVLDDPKAGNRVHLRDCRTIGKMRSSGRFHKYVATTRQDGLFLVDLGNGSEDLELPLLPCQNCLEDLNYQGFNVADWPRKREIVAAFDFEEMLADYSPLFTVLPSRTDRTALSARYTAEWSSLSYRLRSRANWVCQDCGVDCSPRDMRKYLHTHHIDGVKSNNSIRNLEVVCVECHAKKPNHGHMSVKAEARRRLRNRRREMKAEAA